MKGSKGKDSRLTGIRFRFIFLLVITFSGEACHNYGNDNLFSGKSYGKIISDNFIINRDSADSWGNECLSEFNRLGLIDEIFENVYAQKIIPYDYFTGEKLSLDQLKKEENEGKFSRMNISKIRFEENWIWNKEKTELRKEVKSITLAYEVYDSSGRSRGQKPLFRLVFRK